MTVLLLRTSCECSVHCYAAMTCCCRTRILFPSQSFNKKTFVSHHVGGLKITLKLADCNCASGIYSIYREQKQLQLIISHIRAMERNALSHWTGNCYSWKYLTLIRRHSLIERWWDRLPFAGNSFQRLSASSHDMKFAEMLGITTCFQIKS